MLTNCSGGPVLTKIRFASVMMLVVVCLAAAQRPQPAATNAIKIPIETYVLPNGLTVILSVDRSTPTVAVAAWYHVGSKNEAPGRTGRSEEHTAELQSHRDLHSSPTRRSSDLNGLTVILSVDRSTPTVAVAAWYHVGSKNEAPGRTG